MHQEISEGQDRERTEWRKTKPGTDVSPRTTPAWLRAASVLSQREPSGFRGGGVLLGGNRCGAEDAAEDSLLGGVHEQGLGGFRRELFQARLKNLHLIRILRRE